MMKKDDGIVSEVRGSLTVEAAFLLPLIVYLIWNCVFLSFFIYDQCIVMQGSYCSALRAERLSSDESEKNAVLEEKYRQMVEKRVVMCSLSTQKERLEQKIMIRAEMNMKAPGEQLFFSNWKSKQQQCAEKFEPVAFIRKCRKVENITDLLKKQKIEKDGFDI